MKRILVVVILMLAAAAAYFAYRFTGGAEAPGQEQADLFAYSRMQSGNGNGELVLYGNVDIREVPLAFRVGGRLQAMNLEEGDRCSAGGRSARAAR